MKSEGQRKVPNSRRNLDMALQRLYGAGANLVQVRMAMTNTIVKIAGRGSCGTSFLVVTSARRGDVKEVDWVRAPDSLFAEQVHFLGVHTKSTYLHEQEIGALLVEGVRPKDGYTNDDELSAFAVQRSAQTGSERTTPENWLNAFIRLDKEIRDSEKTVVLIDEISWFGYYDAI